MNLKIYIDGNFYEQSEAKISVFDHGLLYGDGVFEGAYSYGSRFGEAAGTNPEQLLAAAHSGCFTMALANALSEYSKPFFSTRRPTVRTRTASLRGRARGKSNCLRSTA